MRGGVEGPAAEDAEPKEEEPSSVEVAEANANAEAEAQSVEAS